MNAFKNSDTFQKLLRSGMQAIGNVITVGVAAFLVLAWILTSPLLRLSDLCRTRLYPKVKGWL